MDQVKKSTNQTGNAEKRTEDTVRKTKPDTAKLVKEILKTTTDKIQQQELRAAPRVTPSDCIKVRCMSDSKCSTPCLQRPSTFFLKCQYLCVQPIIGYHVKSLQSELDITTEVWRRTRPAQNFSKMPDLRLDEGIVFRLQIHFCDENFHHIYGLRLSSKYAYFTMSRYHSECWLSFLLVQRLDGLVIKSYFVTRLSITCDSSLLEVNKANV